MSQEKTTWIFELIDDITKPIKDVLASTRDLDENLKKNTGGVDGLGDSINDLRSKLDGYKSSRDSAFRTDHIRKYNLLIEKTEEKLEALENLPPKSHQKNWEDIALGINQTMEVVDKVSNALSFTTEINKLRTDMQRLTGFTGDALDDITSKAYQLGEVFGDDAAQVARAANAMTDQLGGTFESNLALIQQGYEKGANLNGDMLDQLREYAPQLKEAGLNASEGLAIMAQAAEKGVYSDKALDSLKEANLSLREMGAAQQTALQGIGIDATDLADKTVFEQIKLISAKMQGASTQARQLIFADIFKGAGEDAGAGFIEGLASMDLDINKIPSVQESGQGIKEFAAGAKAMFVNAFGGFTEYLAPLSQLGVGLASTIQLMNGLRKSTMLQSFLTKIITPLTKGWAIATKLLGGAFRFAMGPVGWIITGIGLVAAGVMYAWENFETFRGAIFGIWEAVKQVFSNIAKFIGKMLKPFFDAIELLKKGSLMEAAGQIGKGILNMATAPLQFVWSAATGEMTEGVAEAGKEGWEKGIEHHRKEKAAEEAAKKKEADELAGIMEDMNGNAEDYTGVPGLPGVSFSPPKQTSTTRAGGYESGSLAGAARNVNTRIENLVGVVNVYVEGGANEIRGKIRSILNEELTGAVRDFEVAAG